MTGKKVLTDQELKYLADNWFEAITDLSASLGIAQATVRKQLEVMGHPRPAGKNASLRVRANAYRERLKGSVPEEWHELPATRSDAKELGSSRYWDGRKCEKLGHVSPQKTSSGGCLECERLGQKARIEADPELREKRRQHSKEYWAENKDEMYERWKKRMGTEEGRQWFSDYYKEKRQTDAEWVIAKQLRDRLRKALVAQIANKSFKALELLGCDVEQARMHLESQFKSGMNWDNYGANGWHIDHLRPCNSFDLQHPRQQRACFNWRNLQPMWGSENQSKSDCYTEEDERIWAEKMKQLGYEQDLFLIYQ